ncbi:restriction endonuclease subunit S [Arthrobacter sp. zg-Y1219]|uniref:restriction endonuclease subunit S n=1 Tax=Arthrobacter sp. zg-Y1219 TaxID=3049067 RepID=UPI0024C20C83|nr:restriction endonuclease subunit S [Arthrobacter sp. zg-Y1219]MDK1361350.1 restriction endonuclease subunit S [Arthrobacter sp. zg-Y1219]
MIARPYPVYKDSGIEWAPRIPSDWEIARIKTRVSLVTEKAAEKTNPVALEHIESGSGRILQTDGTFDADGIKFRRGDVLFGKLRPYLAKSWLADNQGEAVGDFLVLRPHSGVYARFLHYITLGPEFIQTVNGSTFGSKMPRASWNFIGNMPCPFPDLDTQQRVTVFLDRETSRLDMLIRKQKQLIELLAEKRQAIITQAVTKGLDFAAPTKPSGVSWIGDVPQHWDVVALKHVLQIPITDGPHETPEFLDEGVPFVSAEAVSGGIINFSKIRGYISESDNEKYSRKYSPQRGDIYMVKSGATTGVTALVETDKKFNIWSPLAAIRCGNSVLPEYLLSFLRSRVFFDSVALHWSFGTQQNIGMGVLGDLPVAIPPLEEQRQIVETLAYQFSEIDRLDDRCTRSVALLKERRSALISAAVTGKIDVRGEAA